MSLVQDSCLGARLRTVEPCLHRSLSVSNPYIIKHTVLSFARILVRFNQLLIRCVAKAFDHLCEDEPEDKYLS